MCQISTIIIARGTSRALRCGLVSFRRKERRVNIKPLSGKARRGRASGTYRCSWRIASSGRVPTSPTTCGREEDQGYYDHFSITRRHRDTSTDGSRRWFLKLTRFSSTVAPSATKTLNHSSMQKSVRTFRQLNLLLTMKALRMAPSHRSICPAVARNNR